MKQIFVIAEMVDVEIIISSSSVQFQGKAIITYDKYTGIHPTVYKNFHK